MNHGSRAKMQCWTYLPQAIALVLLLEHAVAQKIILTNDDGWATAQIRAQRDALVGAGFNVGCNRDLMSCGRN